MEPPAEHALPIPYAFDVAIGYWTGEPDWALVAEALRAACGGSLAVGETEAWLRSGGAAPLVVGAVAVCLEGEAILLRGEAAAVEALACVLARAFGGG